MFWNIQSLKVFTRCSLATSSGTQQELQQHSYFVNSLAILVFIKQELLWDDSKNDLEYILWTISFSFFFCSLYYMVPEDHIALSSYYSSCVGLVCSSVVQSVSSHNSTVIPWGWEQACVSLITFAALVVEEIFIESGCMSSCKINMGPTMNEVLALEVLMEGIISACFQSLLQDAGCSVLFNTNKINIDLFV